MFSSIQIVFIVAVGDFNVSSVFNQVFLSAARQIKFEVLINGSVTETFLRTFTNSFKMFKLKQVTCFQVVICEFCLINLLPEYWMQLKRQRGGASNSVANQTA